MRADGFYHPFVPTPGPLRYRAISPNKESSYVGAATAASCLHWRLQQLAHERMYHGMILLGRTEMQLWAALHCCFTVC